MMSYDITCLCCNTPASGDGTEHLHTVHQLDLTGSTWRNIAWGGHELVLADGTPVVRRTPTLRAGETVSTFDTWEDMQTALNEARAEANQHVAAWAWHIGPGAHVLVVAGDGLCIYGELRHHGQTPADYVFGRWYSVAEPEGELGDNHRSMLTLPLPANIFRLCKDAGWPDEVAALVALLNDTAGARGSSGAG
jgi:hypothetical protein